MDQQQPSNTNSTMVERVPEHDAIELILRLGLAYGAAGVAAVSLIVFGYFQNSPGMMALGGLGVVLVLTVAPVSFLTARSNTSSHNADNEALLAEVRALHTAVRGLAQSQTLSDDARRVLNRSRERKLLIKAIEEDISSEDWEAAIVLCHELANRFGYREDAEQYRMRVEKARAETVDRKVAAAIAALDGLIVQRRWDHAFAQAASIQRRYPDSSRVARLSTRVENARERYKTDLERRFLHAAQGPNPDEAMELLKELDAYLTEAEAEPYRELARGVIGKARDNLGAQFKLATRDHRWDEAAKIGERIISEFPNSRMADEVRSLIDNLRQRAASVGSLS